VPFANFAKILGLACIPRVLYRPPLVASSVSKTKIVMTVAPKGALNGRRRYLKYRSVSIMTLTAIQGCFDNDPNYILRFLQPGFDPNKIENL
jgi:hypothetical protein